MGMESQKTRYFAPAIAMLVVSCVAFGAGYSVLEHRPTDPVSEQLAVSEAKSISEGKHSYGIVRYTHYPNGPQYMLVPLMKMGIQQPTELRVMPLIFSSICLGILAFCLVSVASSFSLGALAVAGVLALLAQPGVVDWMGSLYGNSYSLALCFAAIGISVTKRPPAAILFLLSFISGWMGYDFTFCFLCSVILCRWLVHTDVSSFSLYGVKLTLGDSVVIGGGTMLAILTHLIQNALFFGSMKAAFDDLVGSAAARAGLDVASTLNPSYAQFIQSATQNHGGEYPRNLLINDLFSSFSSKEWSDMDTAYIAYGLVLLAMVILSVNYAFRKGISIKGLLGTVATLVVAVGVIIAAGLLWFFLMPQHARFHFHFIQRHFFVPFFLTWITLWFVSNHLRRGLTREGSL